MVPLTFKLVVLTHADELSVNGGSGFKLMSANSMLSHGYFELQFNRIGTFEMVVPFMFMKWTSEIFTLDCWREDEDQKHVNERSMQSLFTFLLQF